MGKGRVTVDVILCFLGVPAPKRYTQSVPGELLIHAFLLADLCFSVFFLDDECVILYNTVNTHIKLRSIIRQQIQCLKFSEFTVVMG